MNHAQNLVQKSKTMGSDEHRLETCSSNISVQIMNQQQC